MASDENFWPQARATLETWNSVMKISERLSLKILQSPNAAIKGVIAAQVKH